jgi:hypothetical protein
MATVAGLLLLATGAALSLSGCSTERDPNELFAPGDVDVLVVDARLIVDQRLPMIRLSRTLAPNEVFTDDNAAESDATVAIVIADTTVVPYREVTGWSGRYVPVAASVPLVAPETTYRLVVVSAAGEEMSALTTTPRRFEVDSWVLLDTAGENVIRELRTFADAGDSVYDAEENQLVYSQGLIEARFAETGVDGYQLALFSLDLDSDFVIDPPFFDEEDFADLERNGSSPILVAENGTLRLPWFAVYFAGRHLYKIYAVDRNWYDLVRTTALEDGGLRFGGNAGDDFERPVFRVAGGIGLFGSAAIDSTGFNVLPQP